MNGLMLRVALCFILLTTCVIAFEAGTAHAITEKSVEYYGAHQYKVVLTWDNTEFPAVTDIIDLIPAEFTIVSGQTPDFTGSPLTFPGKYEGRRVVKWFGQPSVGSLWYVVEGHGMYYTGDLYVVAG